MRFVFLCFVALIAALPLRAETFRIVIAGNDLGTLSYTEPGGASEARRLETRLSGTPLGAFDGTFSAASQLARADGDIVRQYRTDGGSARSARRISVILDQQGRVLRTDVAPATDRSPVSEPSAVPAGVLDPVSAMGHIINARGCPPPFRAYDGRRIVQFSVTAQSQTGGQTACTATYRVVGGPPHLSPLRLRTIALELIYDGGRLSEITASTSIFTGRITR